MIETADIQFRYSVPTATAGNQLPQANPNASLGGYMSTTSWLGLAIQDLFSLITGIENAASQVDYRCVFVYNTNPDLVWQSVQAWFSSTTSSGALLAVGVDPTGATAYNASSPQAVTSPSTLTAPVGVAFSTPTTQGTAINLGDIAPGQCIAIWFQRTAQNTSPVNNDSFTLSVAGDSAYDGTSSS